MKTKLIFTISCIFMSISIAVAHSGDTIIVPQGTSPIIDGIISSGEWSDAATYTYQAGLSGNIITVSFYVKHNGIDTFYIAQKMPNMLSGDRNLVWLDTYNNGGASPKTDDYMLNKYHLDGSPTIEDKGTGSSWNVVTQSGWIEALTGDDWSSNVGQIEFAVSFSKLGITQGVMKTIGFGIAFGELQNPYNPSSIWSWPANSNYMNPNSWADLIFFDSSTNINEQEKNDISIFPNPATDKIFIEPSDYKNTTIEIANINGQIIKIINYSKEGGSIDIGELISGVYIIKVRNERGIVIKKIVKQ